jgi:hypothetical protein
MTEYFVKTHLTRVWESSKSLDSSWAIYEMPFILQNLDSHFKDNITIVHDLKYFDAPIYATINCTLTFKTDEAEAEFVMLFASGAFDA